MGARQARKLTLKVKKTLEAGTYFPCRMYADRIESSICAVRQNRKPKLCRGCERFSGGEA